jgi:hypothetical protein
MEKLKQKWKRVIEEKLNNNKEIIDFLWAHDITNK